MRNAVDEAFKAHDRHGAVCDTCNNHFIRKILDYDPHDSGIKAAFMRCRTCLMGSDGRPTNWHSKDRYHNWRGKSSHRRGARKPGSVDESCKTCPIHTEGLDWRGTKNRSGNLIVCHPGRKKHGCPRGQRGGRLRRYRLWKEGRGLSL